MRCCLELHPEAPEADVGAVPGGYEVRLHARSLVRDVTILVGRLDPEARVDDALLTLPAGTEATLTVTTVRELNAASRVSHPVQRSANDLQRVRVGASFR
jgi:beta-mannosidase